MVRQRIRSLLKASERLTGTDMVYLARGGFWVGISQATTALSALAFSIIVARYLSQEVYGSYKFLQSVGSIVAALSLTGLSSTITQSVARGHEGAVREGFSQSARWSLPGSAAALALGAYYAWHGNIGYAVALVATAAATPLVNAGSSYYAYLTGVKDFSTGTRYWIAVNLAATAAATAAAVAGGSAATMIIAGLATAAVGNLWAYARAVRVRPPNDRTDPADLPYARHLSAINLFNTIAAHIDRLLVYHFLGAAAMAVYVFASALPDQMRSLLKGTARVFLPKFAAGEFGRIRAAIQSKTLALVAATTVLAVAYMAAAPTVFRLLFPGYLESVPYSRALAASIFTVLGALPLTALQAHSKKEALYRHSTATNAAQLLCSAVAVPIWGMWGAVLSVTLSRCLNFALAAHLLWRERPGRDAGSATGILPPQ
jgi:O-antigen/teichoic acid export membrane protein